MLPSRIEASGNGERRYTVHVVPVARGDAWSVSLELRDAAGSVLYRDSHVTTSSFETADAAAAEGHRAAAALISRLTDTRADEGRVRPEHRLLLLGCAHAVARCPDCGLQHTLFELFGEAGCARCRRDLTPALRQHLASCREIVIRLVDAESAPVEPKPLRPGGDARPTPARRRPTPRPMTTSGCGICRTMIEPGEPVSFQHGALVHRDCYLVRRELRLETGGEEPATAE